MECYVITLQDALGNTVSFKREALEDALKLMRQIVKYEAPSMNSHSEVKVSITGGWNDEV